MKHADHTPFGTDRFGQWTEHFARFFGTPQFIIAQTVIVVAWVTLNVLGAIHHWDPYPFILLNLGFSLQAAYAAPLILCSTTRQADRDKAQAALEAAHREELARQHTADLARNTALTQDIHTITQQIHAFTQAAQRWDPTLRAIRHIDEIRQQRPLAPEARERVDAIKAILEGDQAPPPPAVQDPDRDSPAT